MSSNSHFGLFVGGFALMSLASVYGAEIGPSLLAPSAYAGEIAVPGTIEPVISEGGVFSSYESPRQLTLPPGLPPMIADARRQGLRPILAKAEVPTPLEEESAKETGASASILPNAASCPAANPATHMSPAPATRADSAAMRLSGPAPVIGLGTGTPCPAAARHTSVIAGASPSILPPGPSAPPTPPNAAQATP